MLNQEVSYIAENNAIYTLNDHLRRFFSGGRIIFTKHIWALEPEDREKVLYLVNTYNDFNEDNDPWGEHDFGAGFTWMDVLFEGPEDGWIGHVYALWGEPTQNFLVLSGTGANEGWHYIASSIDPEPDGDFDWVGTLYEGELPPFPQPAE